MATTEDSPHRRAATDFARRVREGFDDVETVLLYGSVARDEARGPSSDVDLLVVLDETADETTAERVRDLAYDVELEHGVVLSLVVASDADYRAGSPFFEHVHEDAEALYG